MNKKTIMDIKLIVLSILLSVFFFNISLADEPTPETSVIPTYTDRVDDFAGQAGLSGPSHTTIIKNVLNVSLGFLGLIFFILTLLSGFEWMTSAGNAEKVKKAQSRLKNAIIGVIIILFSFVITQFVFNTIEPNTKAPENHSINFSF